MLYVENDYRLVIDKVSLVAIQDTDIAIQSVIEAWWCLHQWTESALFQVVAWLLYSAQPLIETMLN